MNTQPIAPVAAPASRHAREPYVLRLAEVSSADLARVGGKNASLGALGAAGVRVPDGSAVTASASGPSSITTACARRSRSGWR